MLMARQANNIRTRTLKPYGLSSVEWFVLGLIQSRSAEGGIRVTDIANILDVQTTYITATLNALRAKGYVDSLRDQSDARVRLLIITKTGSAAVATIEEQLRKAIEQSLKGRVTAEQFESYVHVLEELSRDDHNKTA